jgi:spermidine synthase
VKKKFLFGKNWFIEGFLPGEIPLSTWGFVIEKEIYSEKSKFQKIEVFETKEFGRVLVLDGLVQFTTKNERVYHEMLVHPAFIYHSNPKSILIIGGGDGPALREVLKYPVKEVFLVDIDKKVTEVAKKYFSAILKGAFNDKRLKLFNENALKFIKRYNNFFDVIIEDLTDPTPVAEFCWNIKFYRDIFRALKENGVAAFQSGYLIEPFAKKARKDLAKVFPFFKVHKAFVGCFPFDEHTFSFGSKKIDFDKVSYKKIKERYKKLNLKTKYYSPEIHFASAVLPR